MRTTDCDYCGHIRLCKDDGAGGKGCSDCITEPAMSEAEETIQKCHELLTEAGIEECVAGTVCNDPKCNSKLYHRIHKMMDNLKKTPRR